MPPAGDGGAPPKHLHLAPGRHNVLPHLLLGKFCKQDESPVLEEPLRFGISGKVGNFVQPEGGGWLSFKSIICLELSINVMKQTLKNKSQ